MSTLYLIVLCIGLLPIDNTSVIEDDVCSLQIATMMNGDAPDKIEEQYTKYIFRDETDAIIEVVYVPYAEPGEGRFWPAPAIDGNTVYLYCRETYLLDRKDSSSAKTFEFIRKVKVGSVSETYHFINFEPDAYESSNVWPSWYRVGLTPIYATIKDWWYWSKQIKYPFVLDYF